MTNKLAKTASSAQGPAPNMFYEVLKTLGAALGVLAISSARSADWYDLLFNYLAKGKEPENPTEAK